MVIRRRVRKRRKSKVIKHITIVSLFIFLACQTNLKQASVSLELIERDEGKGHFATVDLAISNPTDKALWIVLPNCYNSRFPESGKFAPDYNTFKEQFGASKFTENGKSAVIVHFYGEDSFDALLIPAKGKVRFTRYLLIEGRHPVKELNLMFTSDILINGKTPLEKWLPYDIKCNDKVVIKTHIFSEDYEVISSDPVYDSDKKKDKIHFVSLKDILVQKTLPVKDNK